jgi:hypothetical protein
MIDTLPNHNTVLKVAPHWKQLKEARETLAKEKHWYSLPDTGRSRRPHRVDTGPIR